MSVSRGNVLGVAGTALLSGQSNATPGIGIVGCGNRSRAHQSGLKPLTEAKVVAVSDIQPDKMAAFNQGLPAPATTYHDYRELLRDKNVGVVVIATPGYLRSGRSGTSTSLSCEATGPRVDGDIPIRRRAKAVGPVAQYARVAAMSNLVAARSRVRDG